MRRKAKGSIGHISICRDTNTCFVVVPLTMYSTPPRSPHFQEIPGVDRSDMLTDTRSTRRIALVVLTRAGLELALRVRQELKSDAHIYASQRALKTRTQKAEANTITGFDAVGLLLTQLWETHN